MANVKKKDIEHVLEHLSEANTLSKLVYYYLYEEGQKRPLTDREKEIDELAHKVHQHVSGEWIWLNDMVNSKEERC